MTAGIIGDAQIFFLIFVRVFALIQTAPLLSSESIPQIAKIGLSFFSAFAVFPWVVAGYTVPDLGLEYAMLAVGEAMIGVIYGFILSTVFAAFQTSGQFFSLQMGFGASQVFDPLAQIEIPLMGQFLNIIAMFVFVGTMGFQKIFLSGVIQSFETVKAVEIAAQREDLIAMILVTFSRMFENALVLSFPILGTLFLVSVTMGLLAKAAPQMNLLMLGFPLSIGVAFLMIFLTMPYLVAAFDRLLDAGFGVLSLIHTVPEVAP